MEIDPTEKLGDIIYGIQHSVKQIGDVTRTSLVDQDFFLDAKVQYSLSRILKNGKKKPSIFEFKDYAPKAFSAMRNLIGVTSETFLKSWQIPKEDEEMTQSTARSGSMFYMTPDKKYLFKTILHPEVEVMMTTLKPYYEHLAANPKTFIVKIYGLFRLSYGSNKTWVLIMGNSMPPSISLQEKYDLKGRKAKPGKSYDERGLISQSIYKDNEINRNLKLDDDQKARYIEQLEKDVHMLEKYDIMDYSLLIGIHKVTEEERSTSKRNQNLNRRVKSNQRSRSEKSSRSNSVQTVPLEVDIDKDRGRSKDRGEKKEKNKVKSRDKEKQDMVELVDNSSRGMKKLKLEDKDDTLTEPAKKSGRKSEERLKNKSKIEENKEDSKNENDKKTTVKVKREEEQKETEKDSRRNSEERKKHTSRKQSEEREKKISRNPSEEKKKISRKNSQKGALDEKVSNNNEEDMNGSQKTNINQLDDPSPKKKSDYVDKHKKITSRTRMNSEAIAMKSRRAETEDEETKTKKKRNRKEQETDEKDIYSYGGFRGVNPITQEEEIIFFGIIDNLTNYNINKKMANFFKNALWDDETLSTVPASFYATRFLSFMTKDLLGEVNTENDQLPPLKKTSLDLNQVDKTSLSPRPATERLKGSSFVVEQRARSGSGSLEDLHEIRCENLRESGKSAPPPVKQEILQKLGKSDPPSRKPKNRNNKTHVRSDSAGGRLSIQAISPREKTSDEN